jgi:uncharacterized delta-60 repeat protein
MRVPSSFGRPAAKAALRSQIRFNKAFIPVLEPLERRALLSAGGHLGTVFTDFDDQLDKGGFVVQSENETLIQVGTTISPACGDKPGFALAQFDAEGILDPNFDSDGLATVCLPDDPAFDDYAIWEVNAVALDSMGRIIIVGTANNEPAGDLDYLVARFNSDGTLDDSFGIGGVVITDQNPNDTVAHNNEGRAVAMDGNKIVVAGSITTNNAEIFGVVRYDEDGTIDPSFNGGQIAANAFVTSFDNINDFDITSTDQVRAVAIDADGKIVLAGSTFDVPNLDFTPAFALQRYNSDGSLDDGFGTNGSVETILNPDVQVDVAYAVTVDSAGRIIAGGTSAFTSETEIRIDLALVRYLGNGDLDTDFGNDGIVTTSVGNGMIGTVNALAIQTDGKILIGGTRYDAMTTTSLLVGRYETNGSLDADFGIVIGYTFEGFPDSNRTSMAVLTNETMSINEVVLGNWVPGDGNGDFVLSRFNLSGDNTPPTVAPISGPTAGVRAFSQTFSSSFTDPDSGDTWTVTWDFGDPTGQDNVIVNNPSSPGALSASHTYLASGAYTVTLNIDDGVNPPVEAESLTITISDTGIVGDSLQVGGTDGNDTITVSPGSGGATDVSLNGDQTSWSGFTQIVIMAGDGNDTVRVNPNVNQSVAIFGGAGDDSLKGGSGDDILIGGDGDDLLHGQAGRDLLIGGDGQDRIVGQTDSDILVAGLSNYDSDLGALNLVLSEWTSSRSYGQRSANIIGHDITIGAFSGPRNNGSIFLTPDGPSATVFDDADVDVLTGSAGEDLFLFNADNPVQDTITDLSAGEFAADLEFLFTP